MIKIGFLRYFNEEDTILPCIDSYNFLDYCFCFTHLPRENVTIDKSTELLKKYITDNHLENKIFLIEYPYKVYSAWDPVFKNKAAPKENLLAAFYNFGLQYILKFINEKKIVKNECIILKVDADEINVNLQSLFTDEKYFNLYYNNQVSIGCGYDYVVKNNEILYKNSNYGKSEDHFTIPGKYLENFYFINDDDWELLVNNVNIKKIQCQNFETIKLAHIRKQKFDFDSGNIYGLSIGKNNPAYKFFIDNILKYFKKFNSNYANLIFGTKKYKLSAIWFSYKDDELLLYESVKRFVNTLNKYSNTIEAKLFIEDDGNKPISENIINDLKKKYNIIHHLTKYKRAGNLNGMENLIGETECFAKDSEDSDAILKIDSDVMMYKLDWILPLFTSDDAILAGAFIWNRWNYPIGGCYAIKTMYNCYNLSKKVNVLKLLENDCKIYPAWNGGYEDYEVGYRLHRMTFGKNNYAVRYKMWYKGFTPLKDGFCNGIWCIDPSDINDFIINTCNFIITGNGLTILHLNENEKIKYKNDQINIMKKMNKDICD